MKIQYLLMALLVVGVFGTSFAIASEGSDDVAVTTPTVSTDVAINAQSIEPADVDASIIEASQIGKYKLVGFPAYRSGFGPLTKGDQGYLGSLGLVKVAVSDGTTDKTLVNARLKFAETNYKLIGYSSDITETKMVLYLVSSGRSLGNAFENEASIKADALGTLTLERTNKYSTFEQWSSSLVIKDGSNAGTWTGPFYLSNEWKKVRQSNEKDEAARVKSAEKIQADGETSLQAKSVNANNEVRKVSFWKRLFPKRVEATAQIDATAEAR